MNELRTKLKVLLWNVENLFLLSDQKITAEHLKLDEVQWQKLSTSIFPNKSLVKSRWISQIIQEEDPDLILLCEVGGMESLQNFNRLFLEDKYSPALIEGNSDRNIDIGFLLRRQIGFYYDIISNKNRTIDYIHPHERALPNPTVHRFSRDAAELHLFLKDREHPFLVFILTHLKSQLDRDRIDPMGFERRQAELKALMQIFSDLRHKTRNQVPIAVCGDFNGHAGKANPDPEFQHLYTVGGLTDVCDLAGLSGAQRTTYYQVGRSGNPEGRQIDYCFLSDHLQPHLRKDSVRVYRFKDNMGFPLDPPTSLDAKLQLPSDHYPLIFELQDLNVF